VAAADDPRLPITRASERKERCQVFRKLVHFPVSRGG
jgi:hypothetical protein